MADIDVQRKESSSIWPWIIGLIVLALLIWLLASLFDNDDEVEPIVEAPVAAPVVAPPIAEPVAPVAAGVVPPAVEEFTSSCVGADADNVTMEHDFTSTCITRLTAALNAVVENPGMAGVDLRAQLDDVRQKADRLVSTPETSNQHANMTRDAFTSVAALVNTIQDARYPMLDSQVGQLDSAANGIQADRMMTDQGPAIHAFFRQAGDVLRAMATTAPTT